MELKLINSQNDSGAIAPHIVRVWQGTTLVLEHYAVPDAVGTVTQKIVTLPAAVYDIEVVNPNLFESRITPIMLFYNPANNYNQEELQTPRRNVLACQSERYSFDGNQIVNLTVETTNVGINNTNVLYSTVGTTSLTSGNDLDGNAIASGSSIPSVLTFKKIADNTLSAMTLPNKKMWLSTSGTVDASAYVPYVAVQNTGSSGLTAPVVATTGTVGVNLLISNVQSGDSLTVRRSNTVATVATLPVSGTTINYAPPSPGTYKFRVLRDGVLSPYSGDVIVTAASNQLGDLAIVGIGQIFVNDSRQIDGLASGANFSALRNDVVAVLGTDYEILPDGQFKFLKFGDYKIWQTKPDFIDSIKLSVNVAEGVKPNLPIPLLSNNSAVVNGTVTVTNYTSYDNIEVKKGAGLAVVGSDYLKVLGVVTFLEIGSYKIFGYKLNYNNSQDSDAVVVSLTPTALHIIDYDLGTFEGCSVAQADIEFGSSATNDISTVADWIQGTRITKDIALVADSTFFWIRDKNNHAVVSPVFQKI
jgi:hypothetical protein